MCLSQAQLEVLVQSLCGEVPSSSVSSGLMSSPSANMGSPKRVKRLQFPQFVAVIDRIATTMAHSGGTTGAGNIGGALTEDHQHHQQASFPLSSWPLRTFLVEHFQPLATAGGSILDSYRRQHAAEAEQLAEDYALQQVLGWNRPQLATIFRVYTRGMHAVCGGGGGSGGGGGGRYAGGTGPGSKLLSRAGLLAFARDFRVVPDLLDLNSDKFVLAREVWHHYDDGDGKQAAGADRSNPGLSQDAFIDFIGHLALKASPETLAAAGGGGGCGGGGGLEADGPGGAEEMDPGSRGRALFAWLDQDGGQGRMRVREISGGTVTVDAFQTSA